MLTKVYHLDALFAFILIAESERGWEREMGKDLEITLGRTQSEKTHCP